MNTPDIKSIILDVDGVIIGGIQGTNNPVPHIAVSHALQTIQNRNIPITLCTGKGTFAIQNIVKSAHLTGFHIGDGGAVIMDFFHDRVIEKHTLSKDCVKKLVTLFEKNSVYLELYSIGTYAAKIHSSSLIQNAHTTILGRPPELVRTLDEFIETHDILKVMPIANNLEEKTKIISIYESASTASTLQWGVHPTALPIQFGLITPLGISKNSAVKTIATHTGISLENTLGIGDSLTDWGFIEYCGYKGIMGNALPELKRKIEGMDPNFAFIGGDVNENGILSIFSYFHLLT